MSRQADHLARIGMEGFAAIDEQFGRAKWWPPAPKVPYVPQTNQIPATKVIDSSEAAQRYNGKVYINYPRGKPVLF